MAFDHATTGAELDLLIPSMTCAGCMRKVEAALKDAAGVVHARANLTAHGARVRFDPELTDAGALIDLLAAKGYPARPVQADDPNGNGDAVGRALLLRMGVAGFAAMNVMLLSVSVWSGAEGAIRDLFHWVSALIALPAMAYAGMPFLSSALSALRGGRLNMDVPISLALVLSGASSVFETSQSGQHAYFDAGIMLVFFLLIGRYLEHHTRIRARSAAGELMAMTGRYAMRIGPDGEATRIAVADIESGMELAIAPGDRIPADGVIVEGRSDLDRSLITGESDPVATSSGEALHAGITNLSGALRMRVTRTGDQSLLAEIARLVSAAEAGKGRYDRMADRAARFYAPGVHVLAVVALGSWLLTTGDVRLSLQIATAVLIITCPCALALAVPTVHTVATGRLFRAGIFLKDGAALERLAEVDTILFDKTGTLTDGAPELVLGPPPDHPGWPLAAALAGVSNHPYSRAIVAEAARLGIEAAGVSDVTEHPGLGVEGRFEGASVRLGRPSWIGDDGDQQVALRLPDGEVLGFAFAEALRPGAREVCRGLEARGYRVGILSGDNATAVRNVAKELGVSEFRAALTPTEKHEHVAALAAQGRKVLMIGDGLNDNPALAAAHASMSPSNAMDATQNVADLVFTGMGLEPVPRALEVARMARNRAVESFGIAAIYNAIAIPLAFAGWVVPLVAALAMSGSSIAVILNALRLRRSA